MDSFKVILLLLFLSLISKMDGQDSVVKMYAAINDQVIGIHKTYKNSYQRNNGGAVWNLTSDSIKIKLDSNQTSNPLILSEFNLALYPIKKIQSFRLVFNTASGNLSDFESIRIEIFNSEGVFYEDHRKISGSSNNTISFHIPKNCYGKLSNNDFKISIVLENGIKQSNVTLEQISLKLDYVPIFQSCSDDILTFYVEPLDDGFQYNWNVPQDAIITSDSDQNIINIILNDANFGEKMISVECTKAADTLYGKMNFLYRDCRLSSISGSMVYDDNCNGIFDNADIGKESLELDLYKGLIFYKSAQTDSLGNFEFSDVESGYYNLVIKNKEGFEFKDKLTDSSEVNFQYKSDNIVSEEFYVESGTHIGSIDLLLDKKLNYDFLFWEDFNLNKKLGTGEILDSIEFNTFLYHEGKPVEIEARFVDGRYKFGEINGGSYKFCVEKNSDIYFANELDDNCIDVDIECTDTIGQMKIEVYHKSTISGEVWLDSNGNGEKEYFERRLANIKLVLLDTLEEVVTTTVSDSLGNYVFSHLKVSDYVVKVFIPDSLRLTEYDVVSESVNSDFFDSSYSYITKNVKVKSGSAIKNIDCGLVRKKSSVGDFVWFDENEDGIQDINELGLNGIELKLYSDSGLVKNCYSISKDGKNGFYIFDSLDLGRYNIEIIIPSKYKITKSLIGDERYDNDILTNKKRTSWFNLGTNEKKTDIDIGLVYNYSSILVETWFDDVGNNVRDVYEKGIDSIKFELYDSNGSFVSEQRSYKRYGVHGICEFDSIVSGEYYIVLKNYSYKFKPVVYQQGNDRDIDSDFFYDNGKYRTQNISVSGGHEIDSIGLGLGLNYSNISGFVWEDKDNDGIIDSGEKGIGNILVELYDESGIKLNSAYTKSGVELGNYSFSGLKQGEYYTRFLLPDEYDYSDGDGGDMHVSGQFGDGSTSLISIGWGDNVQNISAAFINNKSEIGDFVWLDINENGVQDTDEKGVSGVLIYLLSTGNVIIDSTVSNDIGKFLFSGIEEGNYKLKVVIDEKYKFTLFNQSVDLGSKINGANGNSFSDEFRIIRGQDMLNVDVGLVYNYSSIGNEVWLDKNNNGIKDSEDIGVGGIKLFLIDEFGKIIDSTNTNDFGLYRFSEIVSSDYFIKLLLPDTLRLIQEAFDYPITNNNGLNTTDIFTILPGKTIDNVDFGLDLKKAVIGDYIWFDSNENGLQDDEENGLNDVVVVLYNKYGKQVGATISRRNRGEDGYYSFEVERGVYFIQFAVGDSLTATKAIDSEQLKNSDITGVLDNNSTDFFTVETGQVLDGIDAGFIYKDVEIGGRFWYDANGDGILQKKENGINGSTVYLYNSSGLLAQTKTYSSNIGSGFYIFKKLKRGKYYVEFQYPDEYTGTIPLNSSNKKYGSYITNSNGEGTTDFLVFDPGIRDLYVNGGYALRTENFIGDFVWLDSNENGIQDIDEKGINNVKVSLYNANDSLIRVTESMNFPGSDKKGYYKFTNVQAGDYYLRFSTKIGQVFTKNIVFDDKKNSDVITPNGETRIFHIGKLERLDNIDAGIVFISHGSIGDFVWEDLNGNSIQDEGEPGINGVKIKLYKAANNSLLKTQVSHFNENTGENGYYLFENLANRDYYIKIELPKDYILVRSGIGEDVEKDSDIESLITLKSEIIKLKFKEKRRDIDIGLNRHAIVNGIVWLDENENGIQDVGETGVENIHLSLIQEENKNNYRAISNQDGLYSFEKVQAGNYFLKVDIPDDYRFTQANIGTDSEDSDIVNADGTSILFNVKSNSQLEDLDVGLIKNTSFDAMTFPIPAKDELNLVFETDKNESEIKIVLSTINGNIQKSQDFSSKAGLNKIKFNIQSLKPGYYNIIIFVDNEVRVGKYFIKTNK